MKIKEERLIKKRRAAYAVEQLSSFGVNENF